MKTQEQLEVQLAGLIEFCKTRPVENGSRAWIEGQIYILLWALGVPSHEAITKSHDLTNPVKAVCPPPTV